MKKLLNTIYILTPGSYIHVRNQNIVVEMDGKEKVSVPAHNIEAIVCFGQNTVSTPLIGFCGEEGISLVFLAENGKFLGRICGPVSGNVLLRKKQYESLNDIEFSARTVRNILYGKIRNAKAVLMRSARNKDSDEKRSALVAAADKLSDIAKKLQNVNDIDSMRGLEGAAATIYFAQFDNMLDSKEFVFDVRSRRPPKNEVNAALSFVYMLLTREMQSALETVGLDPAAGYLHVLRPGRPSFALDLVEEFRAPLCDRFVLSLFHKGQLQTKDFETDSESVYLNDKGRRTVLNAWQKRKKETIRHPFLDENVEIGMLPYSQAMLFARVLRGDLDEYPPYSWR